METKLPSEVAENQTSLRSLQKTELRSEICSQPNLDQKFAVNQTLVRKFLENKISNRSLKKTKPQTEVYGKQNFKKKFAEH